MKPVLQLEAGSDADRWITLAIYAVCVVAPLLAGSAAYVVHTQPLKPVANSSAVPAQPIGAQTDPIRFFGSSATSALDAAVRGAPPNGALAESIDVSATAAGLQNPVRRQRLNPD